MSHYNAFEIIMTNIPVERLAVFSLYCKGALILFLIFLLLELILEHRMYVRS